MNDLEQKLLKNAQKGDIEAFEKLIEKHQKMVYNIAFRMMGNREDAYDMSQEVFIRVFNAIGRFKGNAAFSTWIYRITKNVCLDEHRKRKNKNTLSIDKELEGEQGSIQRQLRDDSPSPEEIFEKKAMKKTIQEAINNLPDQHKIVIILRDIKGFSYQEIAKIIECPEGTVKSRINRARKALKDILYGNRELLNTEYVK